jgi:putative flippase GtrA
MERINKKDVWISAIIGVCAALVWVPVLTFVAGRPDAPLWFAGGIIGLPIIFIFGLWLGDLLSRWNGLWYRFAKYCAVGFLNTGIDFALFDYLIYATGIQIGGYIALFKGIGFAAGLINSYFWNKYWAFEAKHSTGSRAREFIVFAIVTAIGVGLNVGITALIANLIHPPFGLSQFGWDNAAAVLATVSNLVWNFVGYHYLVFKFAGAEAEQNENPISGVA